MKNLIGLDDHAFLRELYDRANAGENNFVYVPIESANRINAMHGEGPYTHGNKMHGFKRDQLLALIDAGLNKITEGVYKVLSQ